MSVVLSVPFLVCLILPLLFLSLVLSISGCAVFTASLPCQYIKRVGVCFFCTTSTSSNTIISICPSPPSSVLAVLSGGWQVVFPLPVPKSCFGGMIGRSRKHGLAVTFKGSGWLCSWCTFFARPSLSDIWPLDFRRTHVPPRCILTGPPLVLTQNNQAKAVQKVDTKVQKPKGERSVGFGLGLVRPSLPWYTSPP